MNEVISQRKQDALKAKMNDLDIFDNDIVEKFVRSGGPGGQHANRNETCVYLKHEPTEIEVKCAKTRSRENNRYFARKILVEKIEDLVLKEKSSKQQKIEKLKRQKRKRSKRAKEKILKLKKMNSSKKEDRKRILP